VGLTPNNFVQLGGLNLGGLLFRPPQYLFKPPKDSKMPLITHPVHIIR